MALKAGTVGINPKYVDKNGAPKGGSADTKKIESQLTANNKEFYFAYDSTTQKYGYKAGSDGDFTPFEEAGDPGWVAPADLITTDYTPYNTNYEITEGGYKIIDNVVYVDVIVHQIANNTTSSTNNNLIKNLSATKPSADRYLSYKYADNLNDARVAAVDDIFYGKITSSGGMVGSKGSNYTFLAGYYHIWGAYKK